MMYEFKLPDVGEGIHEAVLANWLVAVGDSVQLDQPILEIETDKALVQIPSPVAGLIEDLPLAQGATAQVGDVIVVFRREGEEDSTNLKISRPLPSPLPQPSPSREREKKQSVPVGIAGPGQRILAAPAVRKRALELAIDLRQISGSAAGNRITMDDLQRFVEQPKKIPAATSQPAAAPVQAAPAPGRTEPLQGLRKVIAERMTQAWQIPQVTSFAEVDANKLVKLRRTINRMLEQEAQTERLSYLPFIVKAVIQALQEFPYFNAGLDMDRQQIIHHDGYHIGIATAIPDGLVVPVLRHAEHLSTLQIQQQLTRLSELARSRQLAPAELSGSTFTITNYGSFRGHSGTPIINPPESAILGCGMIEDQPLAHKGKLKLRPVLPLALSFDHRLHDGAGAARFLEKIKALLSDPQRLYLYS